MNITVHDEKMRIELVSSTIRSGRGYRRLPGRLSASEIDVLIERLRGGSCYEEMAERCNRKVRYFTSMLHRVRQMLNCRDDLELAYLAFERGYVVIEEDGE